MQADDVDVDVEIPHGVPQIADLSHELGDVGVRALIVNDVPTRQSQINNVVGGVRCHSRSGDS